MDHHPVLASSPSLNVISDIKNSIPVGNDPKGKVGGDTIMKVRVSNGFVTIEPSLTTVLN